MRIVLTYGKRISHKTYSLDFCIGNKIFLGKGLDAPALEAFIKFFHGTVDSTADTFFIDPDENTPRTQHVYKKTGFKKVGDYTMQAGFFKGQKSYLMVKTL